MKAKFLPFALALFLAPALLAQDYEIRLTRALEDGDELKLSVAAKMAIVTSQTVGDAAPKEQKQDMDVQFDGMEKVIAVDAHGRETKATLTVDKFTVTAAGSTVDIAPKGTVISGAITDGKAGFQIDGKDVEPQVAQALAMVIQLSNGGPTDDEIFGTKDKKKKGDSWDINADVAKKSFADASAGMEMPDLSGKTTINDDAGDALKISAAITGKVKPPLPPIVTLDDSSLTATFTGTFPKDVTKYSPEESQVLAISFSAHADTPNGKVVVKTTMNQSMTRTATIVK